MLRYKLTTGLVIAGAFAMKLRRTLFAQMKPVIKIGQVTSEELTRAAGELNSLLYLALVERLKVSKGDVVRITIEYSLEDGKVSWDLSSLRLEVFRRVGDEEVDAVLKELRGGAPPNT